jgi:hypothetical protein
MNEHHRRQDAEKRLRAQLRELEAMYGPEWLRCQGKAWVAWSNKLRHFSIYSRLKYFAKGYETRRANYWERVARKWNAKAARIQDAVLKRKEQQ